MIAKLLSRIRDWFRPTVALPLEPEGGWEAWRERQRRDLGECCCDETSTRNCPEHGDDAPSLQELAQRDRADKPIRILMRWNRHCDRMVWVGGALCEETTYRCAAAAAGMPPLSDLEDWAIVDMRTSRGEAN